MEEPEGAAAEVKMRTMGFGKGKMIEFTIGIVNYFYEGNIALNMTYNMLAKI